MRTMKMVVSISGIWFFLFCVFVTFPSYSQVDEAFLLFQEAMDEYGLRHLKPAKENLEKLVKSFPKHQLCRRAKIEIARINIDSREYDQAIEILLPLCEGGNNEQVEIPRNMLIALLTELQRFRMGVELLEKWWKESQGDPNIGRKLAAFYLQSGKPDEAKLLLEGLLERTARRDVFEDLLGLAIKTDKVDELLSSIEARSARYKTLDYLDFVSDCYLALKNDEKAATLLRESPETPKVLYLLQKLARIDLARNDVQNALKSFRKIAVVTPNDWNNEKALGHCLFLLGKKTEAIHAWRKPLLLQSFPSSESFQTFIDVLIEHKLYEEALSVFHEARVSLGVPTKFAHERANVLEVLGRLKEAIEEYLVALESDLYKPGIFEKLLELSSKENFTLKLRIKELLQHSESISLKRALLEIYFREKNISQIPEIVLILQPPGGIIDQVFCDRTMEALTTDPTEFLRQLTLACIRQNRNSDLAFQMALCLFEMPYTDDENLSEAIDEASKTVAVEPCPDVVLKSKLLITLAQIFLTLKTDPATAQRWLDMVPSISPFSSPSEDSLTALLLLMKINALRGNFKDADDFFKRAESLAVSYDDRARVLFEKAWLLAQKEDFQEALGVLKTITEDFSDSKWLNDGLSLALFLTMNSTGSLDPLKKYMFAQRAYSVGSISQAIDTMNEIVDLASSSGLGQEAQARVIIMSETNASPAILLKKVDDFIQKHPNHFTICDLFLLKWRLLRKMNVSRDIIVDLLKDFQDRFPGDLRTRRIGSVIEDLIKAKGKDSKK